MSNDKIIPFPARSQLTAIDFILQQLEKEGIQAEIKMFSNKQDAIIFSILQVLLINMNIFDRIVHLIAEQLPDESGESLVKLWRKDSNNLKTYIDELVQLIEEEGVKDE